jgi:transposase
VAQKNEHLPAFRRYGGFLFNSREQRHDAEAICEAAGRPGMHFVPVKSVTQQA